MDKYNKAVFDEGQQLYDRIQAGEKLDIEAEIMNIELRNSHLRDDNQKGSS
ncbi:hypothetical protein [Streptomyces decoyicus]|uniref:hypothetical protein n=1 Tax=Streptomyces decoyicus TaxID=249567 RepID=UPI00365BA171